VLVDATAIVRLKCSFHCFILVIFVVYLPIWGAKVLISFELRKFIANFFSFHFSLFTFFRTFAPKFQYITLFYLYD